MKTCTRCGGPGPFGRMSKSADGLRPNCKSCENASSQARRARSSKGSDDFEITVEEPDYPRVISKRDLVNSLLGRRRLSVVELCNKFDVSPSRLQSIIEEARSQGLAVELDFDSVGIRPAAPSEIPVDLGVAPIVGDPQTVGVSSDWHFGSKYCMRAQLRDFVSYAYSRGVREMLCCGDVLDGCYDHGKWELSHHGIDEQTDDAIATLPAFPGLTYHCIAGNHDGTFTDTCGIEVGPYIEHRFRGAGRDDVKFHGNRGAYLRVRGALVHLWHPQGGVPYALSYKLQKQIEAYSPGLKPDILLTGHLHKSVQVVSRGVHGFLVPCFQSGGSAFGNSLVGSPANGGLILTWRLTEHGTLRSLTSEICSYYHSEGPRYIATP